MDYSNYYCHVGPITGNADLGDCYTSTYYICPRCGGMISPYTAHCEYCGYAILPQTPNPLEPNYGWICPKCGSVYGPHVNECNKCNGNTIHWEYSSNNG